MERRWADKRSNIKTKVEEPRRQREDLQSQIRKANRESNLSKKRAEIAKNIGINAAIPGMHSTLPDALTVSVGSLCTRPDAAKVDESASDSHSKGNIFDFNATQGDVNHLMGSNDTSGSSSNAITTPDSDQQTILHHANMIKSHDVTHVTTAVIYFRRILSIEKGPPIQEVIDAQVVPDLVALLDSFEHPSLQFETAWVLTNIATGSTTQTRVVVNCGAIPKCLRIIKEANSVELQEQAVWTLGNITGDGAELRDQVIDAGGVDILLQKVDERDVPASMFKQCVWTISNLCRGKPPPKLEFMDKCIPLLHRCLQESDMDVKSDSAWAFSYISEWYTNFMSNPEYVSVAKHMVGLLSHWHDVVQSAALRFCGNIVTGTDTDTDILISFQLVDHLKEYLHSSNAVTLKETCWTLSNLTAGTQSQIQLVLDKEIFPLIVEVCGHSEGDVRRECAYMIVNALTGGNPQQCYRLVVHEKIGAVLSKMIVDENEIVVGIVAEGIDAICTLVGFMREARNAGHDKYVNPALPDFPVRCDLNTEEIFLAPFRNAQCIKLLQKLCPSESVNKYCLNILRVLGHPIDAAAFGSHGIMDGMHNNEFGSHNAAAMYDNYNCRGPGGDNDDADLLRDEF